MAASERLIVALDVSSPQRALDLVHRLKDRTGYFKVGLQLFTAAGPELVRKILQADARVFLDLKLHDIPNTVAQAAVESARLGVQMMTLHTLGGESMMRAAREKLEEASQREGWPVPKLLGVTVLTSMDQEALSSIAIESSLDQQVLRLAKLARRGGLDGIVSSARDLAVLNQEDLRELLFVTPGIRCAGSVRDDQMRTATAAQALARGADYLVVGRPVIRAPDPLTAVEDILQEIEQP